MRGSCPDAKLFVHETWAYEEVTSYIDYIIRKNPEDFKQVAFIGTPYKKL